MDFSVGSLFVAITGMQGEGTGIWINDVGIVIKI